MLSQNLVRVLGFSWLRLCRNQRWMLRTSQSSCLESPSSRFSSGCYERRHQKNHFIHFSLTPVTRFMLHMVGFSPLISPAGISVFRTENLVHPFQAWTKIKPRSLIPKQDRKARLLPQSLHIFLSATSNQERMSQPAGWVSSISLQGKNLQRHQQAVHFLRGKKGYTYMSYKQTM